MRSYLVSVEDEEANAFAALLLMPYPQFEDAMRDVKDFLDEDGLRRVARLFQVTIGAVMFRDLVIGPKVRDIRRNREARQCHN